LRISVDRDKSICEDYVIGLLLGRDHWEALQYVLEERLDGSEREIEKVDYTIISYLQDIFDKLNHFVGKNYYGAFDYELKNEQQVQHLKLVFYNTYEEVEEADDDRWIRHTMLVQIGG
jgi:hypothetical protein